MKNVYLGTWLKVPLYINWSWFVFLAIVAMGGLQTVGVLLLIYFFVVLHEYGHCFAAAKLKCPAEDITLYPIGGAARIHFKPGNPPLEELLIAVAGPLVNGVLACIILGVMALNQLIFQSPEGWPMEYNVKFLSLCLEINLVIGAFNLFVLVLPMDGGRVLRSIVQMITGNYLVATLYATRFSQVLSVVLAVAFICMSNYLAAFIFLVMIMAAQFELKTARQYEVKKQIAAILKIPDWENCTWSQIAEVARKVEDQQVMDALLPLLKKL